MAWALLAHGGTYRAPELVMRPLWNDTRSIFGSAGAATDNP